MTQPKRTRPMVARTKHAEVVKFKTSLESLMAMGRIALANPSLEDADGTAYQVLVEDALAPAGLTDKLSAVEGVSEPSAKIELIMQDVIQPQLTTVERLEEYHAEKAAEEAAMPFTTKDQMTSGISGAISSLESLTVQLAELKVFGGGISALQKANEAGVSLEAFKPMALHFMRQIPEINARLGISLEDMEQTQVLGDMTDAVDRIAEVVNSAREISETKASDAIAQIQEAAQAGEGSDFTEQLINNARQNMTQGVKVDEGVNVSTTTDEGTVAGADAENQSALDNVGEGTDDMDLDHATADADAAAAAAEAGVDDGSGDAGAGDGTDAGAGDGADAGGTDDVIPDEELDIPEEEEPDEEEGDGSDGDGSEEQEEEEEEEDENKNKDE